MINALERDGWRLDRQTGSHRQYRHPDRPGTVMVAGKLSAEIPRRYASGYLAAGRTAGTVTEITEYVVVIEQDGDAWGAYVPHG